MTPIENVIVTALKIKIFLVPVNWSLRHQATYHDGHKIAFFLWRKWIRTMECGLVTIKKLLWKLYKSDYIQSFQSAHQTHTRKSKRKRNLTAKENEHFFISTSLQLQYWKNKNKDFLCQICLLSIDLFWLTSCTFDFFYLRVTSRSWTYRSETLEKLSKHQKLWWKRCAG